jgi:hypothetical protein
MKGVEIDALLSAPLGRALLAELIGVHSLQLMREVGHPLPEGGGLSTRTARPFDRPGGASTDDAPTSGSSRDAADVIRRAAARAVTRLDELARSDDPVVLLAVVAKVIANWWFDPVEQAAIPHLAVGADALRPVAQALVASPATRWWSEPVHRHVQRWVGWGGVPAPARGEQVAYGVVQATTKENRSEAQAAAEMPWPLSPLVRRSGTWWSAPLGAGTVSTTRECFGVLPAVGIGCREEWLGEERVEVWALEVDEDARVYEVRTREDWADLVRAYPREVTASRRHDWYRWSGREGPWVLPNWPAVANEWDGVHLTVGGYLTTSGVALEAGEGATLLAGWNPDETVWLRDVFRDVRRLAPWQGEPGPAALPDAGAQA